MDSPTQSTAADPVGHRIASDAVVVDIQSFCLRAHLADGLPWYDTRPMLDPREHCDDVVEMAQQSLHWAAAQGVITRHPAQPWLVRVTTQGQA